MSEIEQKLCKNEKKRGQRGTDERTDNLALYIRMTLPVLMLVFMLGFMFMRMIMQLQSVVFLKLIYTQTLQQ